MNTETEMLSEMRKQAEARGHITLSLSKVMYGFMEEWGGEAEFGKGMARLCMSEEVAIASRVSLANNFTRLLSAMTEPVENDDELMSEEQIKAQLRQLEDQP